MTRFRLVTAVAFAILAAAGCSAQRKVNLAAEEAAIRSTDANWLAAAGAHDLERILPFWSDDATIYPPGDSPIVGKQAIRKYVASAFATPGFSITWQTGKVEIAESGDLAYSVGIDRISANGPDGKSATVENTGVAIWKKQADGSWKCVVDIMSPAATPKSGGPSN